MSKTVSLAQKKYELGKDLTTQELIQLSLSDRCNYIVQKFFWNSEQGFSTHEITVKLIELKALNGAKAMDVHMALTAAFGEPA